MKIFGRTPSVDLRGAAQADPRELNQMAEQVILASSDSDKVKIQSDEGSRVYRVDRVKAGKYSGEAQLSSGSKSLLKIHCNIKEAEITSVNQGRLGKEKYRKLSARIGEDGVAEKNTPGLDDETWLISHGFNPKNLKKSGEK